MIRLSFLMIALFAIPAAASSDVWRWRDASGHLHYSNVAEHVPSWAEPVTTQLGHVSMPERAVEPASPREEGKPSGSGS